MAWQVRQLNDKAYIVKNKQKLCESVVCLARKIF